MSFVYKSAQLDLSGTKIADPALLDYEKRDMSLRNLLSIACERESAKIPWFAAVVGHFMNQK